MCYRRRYERILEQIFTVLAHYKIGVHLKVEGGVRFILQGGIRSGSQDGIVYLYCLVEIVPIVVFGSLFKFLCVILGETGCGSCQSKYCDI